MDSHKTIHLTHVKQIHLPPHVNIAEINPSDFEKVAYSQFQVAQAILDNPNALVLKESLYEDYTPELSLQNQNSAKAKALFPEGSFTDYGKLNGEQKNYLARRSGAVTLYDLGILSAVYKTLEKYQDNKIKQILLLSSGDYEKTDPIRESLAITQVQLAAKKSASQEVEVLLIFGGKHDFTKEAAKHHNIIINTSIAADSYPLPTGMETNEERSKNSKF